MLGLIRLAPRAVAIAGNGAGTGADAFRLAWAVALALGESRGLNEIRTTARQSDCKGKVHAKYCTHTDPHTHTDIHLSHSNGGGIAQASSKHH